MSLTTTKRTSEASGLSSDQGPVRKRQRKGKQDGTNVSPLAIVSVYEIMDVDMDTVQEDDDGLYIPTEIWNVIICFAKQSTKLSTLKQVCKAWNDICGDKMAVAMVRCSHGSSLDLDGFQGLGFEEWRRTLFEFIVNLGNNIGGVDRISRERCMEYRIWFNLGNLRDWMSTNNLSDSLAMDLKIICITIDEAIGRKNMNVATGSIFFGNDRNIPIHDTSKHLALPPILKEGVTLHPYQLEAMSWMHEIELNVPAISFPTISQLWSRLSGNTKYWSTEHPLGGVLADEMGLGKTATAIANAMTKRPAMPTVLLDDPQGEALFSTRATLVVVPNQLPDEWVREIDRMIGLDAVRVIVLSKKVDHKRVTYGDIMQADFVIVTTSFLTNTNHYVGLLDSLCNDNGIEVAYNTAASGKKPRSHTGLVTEKAIRNTMRANLRKVLCADLDKLAQTTQPILEYFAWQRLYFDEAHVMGTESYYVGKTRHFDDGVRLQSALSGLTAGTRWAITGTPFPTIRHAFAVLEFLGVNWSRRVDYGKALLRHSPQYSSEMVNFIAEFIRRLVWRNTREFLDVPAYEIENIALEFTPVERILYDMDVVDPPADNMICTSHRSRDLYSTDDDLFFNPAALDDKRRQRIDSCIAQLVGVKESARVSKEDRDRVQTNIIEFMEERGIPTDAFDFYDSSTWKLDNVPENLPENLLLLLDDSLSIVQEHDWAYRRHQTKIDTLQKHIDDLCANPLPEVTMESPMQDLLIASFGTKLAGMMCYVQRILEEASWHRILVFSRNYHLLGVISTFCQHYKFHTASIVGNVNRKSKALRDFRADSSNVRVMLMTTSESASGTNLIEATHVILLDLTPPYDTRTIGEEQQAIGRAYRQGQKRAIKVVRFYIKDTYEEKLL